MGQRREKLIKARLSKGLSQEAVADGAKMSRKALYACEQGLSNPRDDTIKLLCAFFQTSKEELDLDVVVEDLAVQNEVQLQSATTEQAPQELSQQDPSKTVELQAPQEVAQPNSSDEDLFDSLQACKHRHTIAKQSRRWYNQGKQRSFSPHGDALVQPLVHTRNTHLPERQTSHLQLGSNRVASVNKILSRLNIVSNPRRRALHRIVRDASAIYMLSPYAFLSQESQARLTLAQIHPSYLDDEALNDLSIITARYWRLMKIMPLGTLINDISVHFETIVQFLEASHPARIYNRLCALASENAQLLGRIFHLIKEYDLAYDYYKFALKVALDIGHTDLWAAAVARVALYYLHWGEPSDALPLLQEAQRITLHDPRLEGWLSGVEAEIHAELGNTDACLVSLEKAKNVVLPPSLGDDIYQTGFSPSLVAGFEGACYARLHQPELALPPLEQSLALIDPTYLRSQSIRTTDIGRAYAQLGDPKNACELLSQVLDMIIQTKSISNLQRVYQARVDLKHWKGSAEVQELDDKLYHTVNTLKKRTGDS